MSEPAVNEEIEALRAGGGVVVVEEMGSLTVRVKPALVPPWMIPLGATTALVIGCLAYYVHRQQGAPDEWLANLTLIGVLLLTPLSIGVLLLSNQMDAPSITLTDGQVVLPGPMIGPMMRDPRSRRIPLEDIQQVTYTEQSRAGVAVGGLEILLAEEKLFVLMPVALPLRGPLVRLIRQHMERRRLALAGADLSEPVPPREIEKLLER